MGIVESTPKHKNVPTRQTWHVPGLYHSEKPLKNLGSGSNSSEKCTIEDYFQMKIFFSLKKATIRRCHACQV